MRRTHLEKTLNAAKDQIDVEERACDREILALQGQMDEGLREYLGAKQLLELVERPELSRLG